AQLNAMLHTLENVDDVPVCRSEAARDFGAALHVAIVHIPTTTHVGANCGAGDRTPCGGDVLAASAADLVTEDAPDHAAHDRPANVRAAALINLLAFHPATLLGRSTYAVHRNDLGFIKSFRRRRIIRGGDRSRPRNRPHRRNTPRHADSVQRGVITRLQD